MDYVFAILYFHHYVKACSFYLWKKFAVKQYAELCQQQPNTSYVYCVFWLHSFLLCVI